MGLLALSFLRRSWPYLLPLMLGLVAGWWGHARTHPPPPACPVAAVCPACPAVPEVKCDTTPASVKCTPSVVVRFKLVDAGCPEPEVAVAVPVEASSGSASASGGPPPDAGSPQPSAPLLCPPAPRCDRGWWMPGGQFGRGTAGWVGSGEVDFRLGNLWFGPWVGYNQGVAGGIGVRVEVP